MTRFLERLRRAVPTTHDMPLYAYTDVIRRTSVLKTLRASLAARGLVIVGRGSSLRLRRGATLRLGPRAILLIGVAGQTPAGASIEVRPRGTFEVDGLVQVLRGSRVLADWDASLSIGDRTYLNEGAAITCALRLEIGPGCAIAPGVTITDTDTHRLAVDGRERPHHAATIVGPGCWIGTSALVLKGVTLGRGAVVAAGSVVTHDVLPGRLVGGVPARELAASVTWEA